MPCSFRSAAAAYSNPVRSVPSLQPNHQSRIRMVSNDLKGVRIGFDDKGMAQIIDGRIETLIAEHDSYSGR